MGIASLVLGILSLIIGCIPIIGVIAYITIIVGIILGIVGCVKKPAEGQPNKQKVPAIIGIIIGVIALIVRIVIGAVTIGTAVNTAVDSVIDSAIDTVVDANAVGDGLNSLVSKLEEEDVLNKLFSTNTVEGENTEGNTTSSSESTGTVVKGKMNEAVVLKNAQLTVNSTKRSKGDGLFKADDGKEYIIINTTIKNAGTEELNYNTLYFSLKNTDGQEYTVSFLQIDESTRLGSGKLASGETASGDLVFEIKEGETGLTLVYEPFILEDDAIEIAIS